MISSRYHGSIRLHFLLKLSGGILLFWALVWGLHWLAYGDRLIPANYVGLSLLIPAAALVEFVARDRNSKSLSGLARNRIWNITQREILFLFVTIFGVLVMSKDDRFSRLFLGLFALSYSGWIAWMNHVGHRIIQRRLYRSARKGADEGNTVVLAPSRVIENDSARTMNGMLPGADFLGYVNYGPSGVLHMPTLPVLGDFQNIKEICRDCHARMLLALGLDDQPQLIASLQRFCDSVGMRLVWVDDKRGAFRGNLDTHQSGSQLLLTNWHEPLEDPLNRVLKRTFDLTVSLGVTLTVLPALCLFTWTLHRLFSPGPLFFRQPRTGRDLEVFDVLKFRTMHLNDSEGVQASEKDARIFPGGKFLRKFSLDEFPQFINVLRGEMSTVGPRPHFVDHDAEFAELVEDYRVRHLAKPGVTGLAQVKGLRGETDTRQKIRHRVKLDQFYLRHWSLYLDFCIVLSTTIQVVVPPRTAR